MRLLQCLHTFTDLLYPPRCLICLQPLCLSVDSFCDVCRKELFHDHASTCPRCALTIGPFGMTNGRCATCMNQPLHFDAALRLGIYQGRMAETVLRLKHASNEGLAELLGQTWGMAQRLQFTSLNLNAVVAVPLHWSRRLRRGYNQSAALAFGLSQSLRLPYLRNGLKRIRATRDQKMHLSLQARRENVQNAFRARTGFSRMHVLLIDDVMTTGSTASEAARALKKAGASRITVAVLARAGG